MADIIKQIAQGGVTLKKTTTVDKSSARRASKPNAVLTELPATWKLSTTGGLIEQNQLATGGFNVVQGVGPSTNVDGGLKVTFQVSGDSGVVALGVVPSEYDLNSAFLSKSLQTGTAKAFKGIFLRTTGSLSIPGTPEPLVSNAAKRGIVNDDKVAIEISSEGAAKVALNGTQTWEGQVPPLPPSVRAFCRLYRLGDAVKIVPAAAP